MSDKFDRYQSPEAPVPDETWAWNMYGAGVENIGRDGKPERVAVPEPGPDQLLVRVDAVGMCYSDVKLIKQGGSHPKLYNRDLATNPTRLGHEATHTVEKVGEALRDQFYPGQRLALQPDIYQQGRSTAYGYTIPGGLIQFHLIGPEVLDADAGSYVIPLEGDIGYAEAALTEPWACVEAAYTQRRRLAPKPGGTMWIVGHLNDSTPYEFSTGLDAPATMVVTDVPLGLLRRVQEEAAGRGAELVERNGLEPADYQDLGTDLTDGVGFDDIVVLDPHSAEMVGEAARLIARRGTFNLVGREPLDGRVQIDVGRIHYDYTAYVGNPGTDIAASYGEERNRCELRAGGTAVLVGAAGPMGQMHVQRAIELAQGPSVVIATDINPERLAALKDSSIPLAQERGKRLIAFNPSEAEESLHDLVMRETDGRGADDVVVCVPVAPLMADSAQLMAPDGMLVLFAGVPNGTMAPLDMSVVYRHNAQYTGTSGSTMDDQRMVVRKTLAGELSPNRSVAAIGGIEAAQDSVRAMMEGDYPGKIVVFPQLTGVPLTGLSELTETLPHVAERLGPGDVWTREAERELIERYWRP
ncbi:MAG: zinc-binding dehydrogenase [Anaerolineae bacterium]|jgi:threonine dehydrogenase-like Zn-dependent dehydrogenase